MFIAFDDASVDRKGLCTCRGVRLQIYHQESHAQTKEKNTCQDIIADNGSQAQRPQLWSMLCDFLLGSFSLLEIKIPWCT